VKVYYVTNCAESGNAQAKKRQHVRGRSDYLRHTGQITDGATGEGYADELRREEIPNRDQDETEGVQSLENMPRSDAKWPDCLPGWYQHPEELTRVGAV